MSRPKTRVNVLDGELQTQIRTLFGTIQNAHDRLGLLKAMSYSGFYRAMNNVPISDTQREQIVEAWNKWCRTFTGDEQPLSQTFTVEV